MRVWVEVDDQDILDDICSEDLYKELRKRDYKPISHDGEIEDLFQLKRNNDPRFDEKFAEFIWNTIGRVL